MRTTSELSRGANPRDPKRMVVGDDASRQGGLEDLVALAEATGATVVMVTHELPSIFTIANNAIYLDAATQRMIDKGDPKWMREHSTHDVVRRFLRREAEVSTQGE